MKNTVKKPAYSTSEEYEKIVNHIVDLDYAPGQILNESDLIKEYNISRAALRDIFRKLENYKLLQIVPRKGVQVSMIDYRIISNIFEMKRELEGFCARLAAERIDEEKLKAMEEIVSKYCNPEELVDSKEIMEDDESFHKILRNSCQNVILAETIDYMHLHLKRLWNYAMKKSMDVNTFIESLNNMIEALKKKDGRLAEEYARAHVDMYIKQIKDEL